jgi:N-acetylated-alpha-linked acidic dipeptidase
MDAEGRGMAACPCRAQRSLLALAFALAISTTAQAVEGDAGTLFGFNPAQSARERALEQAFDADLRPADLRAWLKELASAPNHVGSPHDKANAELVRDLLRSWGWEANIEVFEILYPTLREHSLELVAPTHFTASLSEPAVEGDATSARTDELPPYHTYGADGDVTAELVYVNYGMAEDYRVLARQGVDVRGKIVIARYGEGWRGLKPKLAAQHGAIGCIIYSDPLDDGYGRGDVYPSGGWRPAAGVQRGSVLDLTQYPGDPLTPGVGATHDAKRLPLSQAQTLSRIPVLPISYGDAQPLLAALGRRVAPSGWRGGLPITYHLGPGPAQVHLVIRSDWTLKPIYDVVARISGSEKPQQWVVRGNHRDGWVFGAWDPLSGTIAMLAEAKAIGALVRNGWRPRRSLVYTSWDGEEPGLIGSTEWAETHAAELQRKAVAYLNSDSNVRGFLSVGGSPSLERLVNDVAAGVRDPQTGVSTRDRLRARILVDAFEGNVVSGERTREAKLAAAGADLPLAPLGLTSDYSPFLDHLGLASLNIEYRGEAEQEGAYHSKYDSFDHYVRFGDPDFTYGVAEAETAGHIALRLADADVLPLTFTPFAEAVADHLEELRRLVDKKRSHAAELAQLLERNAFMLAVNPTRMLQAPASEAVVPEIDFGALDRAVARLKHSAAVYDETYLRFTHGEERLDEADRARLNTLLQGMEQRLTDARGLPGRDWYKHFVYAPGVLTGYAPKTLPAVHEAIDAARWSEAQEYVHITARVLEAYGAGIEQASALLLGGRGHIAEARTAPGALK